jgi:predicted RNase H-like HicB family nuclease
VVGRTPAGKAKKIMKRHGPYTAVYEPAGEAGWWTVSIAEVPGCISQGRSISQARTRIREALGLYLDLEGAEVELRDELRLGRDVQRTIDVYRKRRERAERETEAASTAYRNAVRVMLEAGMSTRDAGEALGVSQARIAQLATEIADRSGADATRRVTKGAERRKRAS